MEDKYALDLYDHNMKIYEAMTKELEVSDIVAIIQATGTGKDHNALQYAYDNKDKRGLFLVPSIGIIEHCGEIINNIPSVDLKRDFANLRFITYHSLVNMSYEELANLEIDYFIVDELQHLGAPVWGPRVEIIVNTHPHIKVIGMTAYTTRDRGTAYERDLTDPDSNELFSNKVVCRYDLCDAWIDCVLPKPIYKSGYIHIEKSIMDAERLVNILDHNSTDYHNAMIKINDAKKMLNKSSNISDIFKKNIKPDGKYIYICPTNAKMGVNDINTIMNDARIWCHEMGLGENDYEFYMTTSKMGKLGEQNRNAFYNDLSLSGEKMENKLRIMFAINQYNEGVHAPGIDGIILGRTTKSDILFFEWLGRALSVTSKKDREKEYKLLLTKSKEELETLCRRRDIHFSLDASREELIELLLSPLVIDLGDNISYIRELENNLKARVKEMDLKGLSEKRQIHLINSNFNIEMLNQDIYSTVENLISRLQMTWEDYYNLAKAYYDTHKNLYVKYSYRTINGYEEDETGIRLGYWIDRQRTLYEAGNLSKEKKDLLDKIGMIWEGLHEYRWWQNYELAKAYYEEHKNLDIPNNYVTINGKDEFKGDKNTDKQFNLGTWISRQRQAGKKNLPKEKADALDEIQMIWEDLNEYRWWKNYELAKAYYEEHKKLDIPTKYVTINGKDEFKGDKNTKGIVALGTWITNQKCIYFGSRKYNLSEKKIEALDKIGMIWKKNSDNKKQSEEINDKNIKRKQIEILNRIRTFLNKFPDTDKMPTKEDINQGLIDELDENIIGRKK